LTQTQTLTAASIHAQLEHPVIDADGHFLEMMPLVNDEIVAHLETVGGKELRERYLASPSALMDTAAFEADRSSRSVTANWRSMPSWWGNPVADPRDRATAHLPRLLYERLDELGVDLMFAYPSWTLGLLLTRDSDLRAPICRAVNKYSSRLFAPYADRIIPAAIIPMETPDEAVEEIDYAVGELGHKLVVLGGQATRAVGESGDPAASRIDVFGLDSPYDYDKVWAACVRNQVAPVFHSSLQMTHPARSITNYSFNHIGGIAHSHEALCKALFIGGVYRRFPELRFGYLEGGVMWGASLLADLLGHWDKRGAHAINDLDPNQLDVEAVIQYVKRYGTTEMIDNTPRIAEHLRRKPGRPSQLDDFEAAKIEQPEDIIDPFVRQSFFGCEADDPLMPFAFQSTIEHQKVVLQPILGTDVSHWDAPVMNDVLCEAFEPVSDGFITPDQFRALTFSNAVKLHGSVNPSFFSGTSCEKEAGAELE
jgi:predicted TIM-barrel fold metal-dependent hydrolase